MQAGLEWIVAQYPLKLKGLDFDNGTEFLNWGLIAWADAKGLANITRSRPYQHNDNAHVEQRNGDWVRKHAFRFRYTTDAELAWLNELWEQVCFKKNYILPCKKAVGWEKTSSGRSRRVYDKPATPYRRLLWSGALDDKTDARLAGIDYSLNPAKITRRINSIQQKLIGSAAQPTQVFAAAG
ncbi:MAG: hypothetical protein LBR21_00305 [Propionibacteriaceae bacterium]|jgi:hypothetical protein|nr:hypothetical protein [Propionibacteriaceae bacterium]